jgi:hypothetical protein
LEAVLSDLRQDFTLKDLSALHYFLGIEAEQIKEGTHAKSTLAGTRGYRTLSVQNFIIFPYVGHSPKMEFKTKNYGQNNSDSLYFEHLRFGGQS